MLNSGNAGWFKKMNFVNGKKATFAKKINLYN
jgi:hypothetical protein